MSPEMVLTTGRARVGLRMRGDGFHPLDEPVVGRGVPVAGEEGPGHHLKMKFAGGGG